MPVPATYTMAQDQRRAQRQARTTQDGANHGANIIEVQDEQRDPGYVIYVYNILDLEHIVEQPPIFSRLVIPRCPKGEKISVTLLPAYVKLPFCKPGTTEYYYRHEDGRKAATSALNPSAFPSINWQGQLQEWDSPDQFGNNLNALGCWWSLTRPDETEALEKEIKLFRQRVQKTMQSFVNQAEIFAAANDMRSITPLMHFAMDYLGKQAPWHMPSFHMISCPNCGDPVKEGIAYHRNSFGERCIIDEERYLAAVGRSRQEEPRPPRKGRAA